jgi:D-alanyl-D-alanine carboxypeptidase (penicillin-binding protein 5/6)
VSLDTPVKVSTASYKIGGSQVWLDPKETFPLSELLKTVAIKSANDSAYLVAEFIGNGDVSFFVQKMNDKAKEIKMPETNFSNPHGLPEKSSADDNKSSPEGLAILAEYLLEYPLAVKWASTPQDVFRKGTNKPLILHNHNSLVKNCAGVDGMKTGYIKRSGYCTTVTCKRGSRRLVAVVTGFPLNTRRGRERDNFVRKLLDWGYKRANQLDSKK